MATRDYAADDLVKGVREKLNSGYVKGVTDGEVSGADAIDDVVSLLFVIEQQREALTVCAEGFVFADQHGIRWENIAREFSRRQQTAALALGRSPLRRGKPWGATPESGCGRKRMEFRT